MISSIEQITDELQQHGLLDEESLAEACHALEKRGDDLTGSNLLSLLTEEGKLTPFQAEEIGQGRASALVMGNYLLLSRIGEGGMGTVFKALHRRMQRVVAIKVIRKEIATREFIARFRREIQLSARLNHPNVVIAYDADQCPMGDFLVMEYVEGVDLGEVLRRTESLSIPAAISAIRQAALALGYAHQQGIVHRDIKPANLLRDINGCVKVVDLGLARLAERDGSQLTHVGGVAGTVDYMSPEQAENALTVDGRSDIYSLGCTLFFLLTNGPVFTRTGLIARILAHRTEPPPNLTVIRSDVPPELDAIFQHMVAKSPDKRYASMEEVVAALDSLERRPSTVSISPAIAAKTERLWSPELSTVLVVEESRLQAQVIRKILGELGVFDIHVCASGGLALERLESLSPQVLLCSMRLADMSGLELAARIRESRRWLDLVIVLMSVDDSTSQYRSTVKLLSRVQFLKKPFNSTGLRATIELAFRDGSQGIQPLNGLADLRVLIVDDSAVARRHEKAILSELGFTRFTEAEDGMFALEEMERIHFDLIVTDYRMPRMDGHELITRIRQHSQQQNVPIIMVTTEFDPQKLGCIYQLGVSAICNKNFDRELVRNIVIQLFA